MVYDYRMGQSVTKCLANKTDINGNGIPDRDEIIRTFDDLIRTQELKRKEKEQKRKLKSLLKSK